MTSSDLAYRFSVPSASAGNQLAQAVLEDSLGGYLSTTDWLGAAPEDLFETMSGDDNAAEVSKYRCLFVVNKHASESLTSVKLWFTAQDTGGSAYAVGVDPTVASAMNSGVQQALKTTGSYVAPAGVTFSAPSDKTSGVSVGTLSPGQTRAIWVRRTGTDSARKVGEIFSVRFEGYVE